MVQQHDGTLPTHLTQGVDCPATDVVILVLERNGQSLSRLGPSQLHERLDSGHPDSLVFVCQSDAAERLGHARVFSPDQRVDRILFVPRIVTPFENV